MCMCVISVSAFAGKPEWAGTGKPGEEQIDAHKSAMKAKGRSVEEKMKKDAKEMKGEAKEKMNISTFARKIGFSRQMFINDDMGALDMFPRMWGAAASRLESDIIWGLILDKNYVLWNLQKRKGAYAKENLSVLFSSDEYLEAQDNFVKQGYIKKAFTAAEQAAYGDLIRAGDNPYSKAENVNTRITEEATEKFAEKILTLNQGEPIQGDYFEQDQ